MDTPQSETETATNALLKMPQQTKVLMVIAALALAAIAVVVNLPKKQVPCELIQGCSLRNSDLQRMQIALSSAGLNESEIKGQSIYVPKLKRAAYLKAVTEAGALPSELCLSQDEVTVNPLLSRDQREQIQLKEKKKQIREMVTRLPFVEQAWFEMDRTKAKSAFHHEQQSAVVLIQPKGEHLLDSEEIETIRGLITGSIAGMERNSIVVTDLNDGFAHQESDAISLPSNIEAQQQAPTKLASTDVRDKKNRYENKIREALADMPGVSIEVEVTQSGRDQIALAPKRALISPTPRVMTVGTNSQAAVHVAKQHEVQAIEATSPIQEIVKVKVEIPETLVLSEMKVGNGATVASLRKEPAYRSRLEAIQSNVTKRVRPTLPILSFSGARPFPISFSLLRVADDTALSSSPSIWAGLLKRIGGPWGAIAVLAASLFIVVFVFSGSSKQIAPPPMPQPVALSEPEPIVATTQDQDIRQEISQLINEDPEAAAQVIKRWIRNAA